MSDLEKRIKDSMGSHKGQAMWGEDEIAFACKWIGVMSVEGIAYILGRSPSSVKNKLNSMGVHPRDKTIEIGIEARRIAHLPKPDQNNKVIKPILIKDPVPFPSLREVLKSQ